MQAKNQHSLVSPSKAQVLITDVLMEIFQLSLPRSCEYLKMRINMAPLNISQVCRSWRAVALSLPRLWSRIHIKIINHGHYSYTVNRAIRLWLSRSRMAKLSVKVDWAPGTVASPKLLDVVLYELAQCSNRIEKLSFVLPECFYREALALVGNLQANAHSLSMDLYLGHRIASSRSYAPNLPALAAVLSQLDHLEIKGKWPPTFRTIEQFSSVTKLDLNAYVHPDTFGKILERFPSLEELRCTVYSESLWLHFHITEPPYPQDIITLPSVRFLEVRADEGYSHHVYQFLIGLKTPSLRELIVNYVNPFESRPSDDWTAIVDLLEVSQPPLQSLSLINCPFSETALTACLQLLPELRTLRCCASMQVAKVLGITSGQPVLCPNLERMVLEIPALDSVEAESMATALEDVVRSRFPSGSTGLLNLDLPSEFVFKTRFTERVQDCITMGLRVGAFDSDEEAS